MKKLNINRLDFELAFELTGNETTAYLDSKSGEILFVEEYSVSQLDKLLTDEESLDAILVIIQAQEDLRDDERVPLLHAARVRADTENRYLMIPKQDSREGFRDMEDYIESLTDEHLRELLSVAILGSGAFHRFKDILFDYPEAETNWFKFYELREQKRISDWFASEEIEPVFEDESL